MALSVVVFAVAVMAPTAEQSWTGRLVFRGGVPPKYGFEWDVNWNVYDLANQEFPGLTRHVAHPITLTGELKNNTITIRKAEGVQPLASLQRLFPGAGGFSGEIGDPPHFVAYAADPRRNSGAKPIGHAFWTSDLVPDERGYHGRIVMLVGMATTGILTGVIVVEESEPYGNISVARPEFASQFTGKSIRSQFRVGIDVDAVANASITIGSATRAIRDSSRTIARSYLKPDEVRE